MDATLAALRHRDHRPPSEDELRRLTQYLLDVRGGISRARLRTSPIHHFRVTVERDERDAPGRTWQITVGPGTVDERPVMILYRRQGDLRGWTPPDQFPAPVPAGYPFADRTLFDGDEPVPCLLIPAPPVPAPVPPPSDQLFLPVPDGARPEYFRTADAWTRDLFQASVVLSSDTRLALPPGTPLPAGTTIANISRRTRVHVSRVPSLSQLGSGTLEVARLYLLRDPGADATADDLLVQQRLYWSPFSAQVALTHEEGDPLTNDGASAVVDGYEVLWWTA